MEKQPTEEKILKTSAEIWAQLIKRGSIQECYDSELIVGLKRRFRVNESEDLLVYLEKSTISSEEFLSAFFHELSPYVEMYKDLLKMFEKANAKCTDQNLKIDFDFGSGQTFDFSIGEFRQYTEKTQRIMKIITSNQIELTSLWNIIPAGLPDFDYFHIRISSIDLVDDSAARWLKEYDSEKWMQTNLQCPVFDDEAVTEKLRTIWMSWSGYAYQCRKKYANYKELVRDHENIEGFWAEIDRVSFCFVEGVFLLKRYLEKLDIKKREEALSVLKEYWGELIDNSHIISLRGYEEALEEILELPIWKKRYELYSAWISTRILNPFPQHMVEYHVVYGKLSYSFGGAKIATIAIAGQNLYLWAELRTRFDLSGLKRISRKKHIQPDYRMITDEDNPQGSTVAVIECKQYQKANRKNFLEALTDYANACPEADVILADYGPSPDNLTDGLEMGIRGRCFAFGELVPESAKVKMFEQALFQGVLHRLGMMHVEAPLSVELIWGEYPKDLDLWMEIESRERKAEIGYRNKEDEAFGVYYDCDITAGFGPEYMGIEVLHPAVYTVKVHNYSQEIYEGGAEVIIRDKTGQEYRMELTEERCSDFWWNVARIDGDIGLLQW